jgi:hypothetical protein
LSNPINPKRSHVRITICIALVLACSAAANRRLLGQAAAIPTAPRPAQLAAAKTVFISNGFDLKLPQGSEYDQVYAAVQKLNRFTIVSTPQDADLILEFSDGGNELVKVLHIFDPKTHTLLWSVRELSDSATRRETMNKNEQEAVDRLAADLQKITAPSK